MRLKEFNHKINGLNLIVKKIYECIKKNNILKALLINILTVAFFDLFFQAHIHVDDLQQSNDVSGLFTNASDYHLQWGGLALGKVLQFFYHFIPGYNWYSVNQYVLSFVSLTIFSYIILNKQWGNIEKYILFTILFSCGYELYVAMNFTKTAGIIGAIAVFILISENTSKILNLTGGVLFWWSTQIRFAYVSMFEAGVIFVLIVKIFCHYKDRTYMIKYLKRIALLVIFFIVIAAERKAENVINEQDPVWNEYAHHNAYRASVYDMEKIYSNYDEYADEYLSLGITKNMAIMWSTNNPDFKYPSLDVFSKALDIGGKMNYEIKSISKFLDFHKINKFLKTDVLRYLKVDVWFSFFIMAVFVFIFLKADIKVIVLFLISNAFLIFEYYLYVNGRYARHRIDIPIVTFMMMFFLLLLDKIVVASKKVSIGYSLMLTILLYILLVYNNDSSDYFEVTEEIQNQIDANRLFYKQTNSDKDNVYFQIITSTKREGRARGYYDSYIAKYAFDKTEPGYLKNVTFAYSTPIKDKVMQKEYGITDIWMDAIDNESVYIVLPNDQAGNEMVTLTANYLTDRKGEDVKLVKVKYYSDKNIYKAYSVSYDLSQKVMDDVAENENLFYKLKSNSTFKDDKINITCNTMESSIELSGTVSVASDTAFQNRVYLCVKDSDTGEMSFYDVFQNFGNEAIDGLYTIQLSQKLPDYYSDDDELTLVLVENHKNF